MSPPRSPLFDNARGLLIVLVVIGHSMEPLFRTKLAVGLYDALYLFHIPAFAALSGHLSKRVPDLRGLLLSIALPLLIFQALYVAFAVSFLGNRFGTDFLDRPYWLLWFLLSLLCWRLVLPVLRWTRAPLLVSIALCLAAGAFPQIGYPYSLSRTFVFLPCFVAGHVFRREWVDRLRTPFARAAAVVVFVGLGAFAALIAMGKVPALNSYWLYGSIGYSALRVTVLRGVLMRAGFLAIGLVLTAAFFALAPSRASFLTGYGARSLAPYLLHGFVLRGAGKLGWFGVFHGAAGVAEAIACAVVLALVAGAAPIARLTAPLWNPASLLKRRGDAVPRPVPPG